MTENVKPPEDMNILAIETSCDETAAAIVKKGREVVSNALYSQIDIHKKYGGVVPEIASRNHVEKLPYIVEEALAQAGYGFSDIDALAVTRGPGLIGALITGVSYAKALSYALKLPLIPVNHIEGHISANYITHGGLMPPFICLIASGGHTNLIKVLDYCRYEPISATQDDAAGEAFDKVARVLGLPYPGGPNLEKLAQGGKIDAYPFTRPFKGETHLDFSFSGIKTAVLNLLHSAKQRRQNIEFKDLAASFQHAVVSVLTENAFQAAERAGIKKIVFGGGVSANGMLRELALKGRDKYEIYLPDLKYCTDNAAMIASAAYYRYVKAGETGSLSLNPSATLELS